MKARRIGPYRIEQFLGAGGMGAVYLAFDERLQRRVALKRVHPEIADDEERRRRFRREARAAAGLVHPAVVQVYDLVEGDEDEWIVMEYVPGEPLDRLLAGGPLPLPVGMSVAVQVAEGLAAAHRQGIVHRDLKAENVIVSHTGAAKITDFGIARRWSEGTGPADGTTEGGDVVGTLRAMSPEQSRDLPLGPPSDLFALGVLLYEIFTGASPFRADRPAETLDRVRRHLQVPARRRASQVPPALSDLIDRLLEKSPTRRPAGAAEVAARLHELAASRLGEGATPRALGDTTAGAPTLTSPAGEAPPTARPGGKAGRRRARRRWAALTAAGVGLALLGALAWWRLAAGPLRYVAVAPPEVEVDEGGGEAALIRTAVETALVEGLIEAQRIAPLVATDRVERTPLDLARVLAADEVIAARVTCAALGCTAVLRRLDATDGAVLAADTFEIPADDRYLLAAAIGRRVAAAYPRPRDAGTFQLDVDPGDYDAFLRLRRAYAERSMSARQLLAAATELRRRARRFPEAYRLEADAAYAVFFHSRDAADLEHAFELLEQAERLAPRDPQTLFRRFRMALDSGRLDMAEEALSGLEALEPGDARLAVLRALLGERRGRPRRALARMRAAVTGRPSAVARFELASMEYRLGEIEAARATLTDLLADAPHYAAARSTLAQLELVAGELERAATLYEELAAATPGVAQLSNLGLAQLLLGRYREAAASFEQALALAPGNPATMLNLADALHLLGDPSRAHALYRRASESAVDDPADESWQQLSVAAQALAHLGRAREAAAAIQRALQLAADNPQVAYEAALVYTLIGEEASALVNAERASTAFGRHWFSLPWFDPLRGRPEFRRLFAAESGT